MMKETEDELTRRCQRGDADAFGVLVKRYAGRATVLAALLVGNRTDAVDVSQEAFVRAWRHIRTFEGRTSFYAWYCSILRNTSFTWLKKHKRGKDTKTLDGHDVPAPGPNPAMLAERNEQAERLLEAINQLSSVHREIIGLSHFEQLSYKEIAAVLEIPLGTVMSRLHAAREALRARLAGEDS